MLARIDVEVDDIPERPLEVLIRAELAWLERMRSDSSGAPDLMEGFGINAESSADRLGPAIGRVRGFGLERSASDFEDCVARI